MLKHTGEFNKRVTQLKKKKKGPS